MSFAKKNNNLKNKRTKIEEKKTQRPKPKKKIYFKNCETNINWVCEEHNLYS